MVLVVGLDGGATRSTCAIATDAGKVLGIGFSGPVRYHDVGAQTARNSVSKSIEDATTQAGMVKKIFDVGCFGMGGLDSEYDYRQISRLITSLNVARKYVIVNDVTISYYAVTAGKPGIAVVAGTGSIAYGMNERGEEARSGGWGWLIGDEGSAFDISKRALMAAAKAHDGRGPPTLLLELFKKRLKLRRFEDVVPFIHLKEMKSTDMASLAPIVALAAKKGDEVAVDILEDAGEELGIAVIAVAEKLGIKDRKVIVGGSGGVFKAGNFVWNPFKRTVRASMPNATFQTPIINPVIGSIILGLKRGGVDVTDDLVAKLRKSLHEKIACQA